MSPTVFKQNKVEIKTSSFGIWLLVYDTEYFLSYKDYPWFEEAKISDIYHVELLHKTHLHWPMLDVDLDLDSIKNPEKYPLVYHHKH
jgi:hypothetical protein